MFTLHYAILCTTMDLSGSSLHYTMYISYILQCYFLIVFYLQQLFQFLLSSLPAFLVFQVLFCSLYLYIVVLHPFITTLLWKCLPVHGCVFSSFLSLFWCRNLFLVQIIPFSQPIYISVYRLLFCLKILRCLCVVISWFATIAFPVSAYIDSLCARTSMLVNPQHQYIVFLKQFLKGGFYTEKIWAPPTAEITCSSKRRFLHTRKGKFLFHSLPCPYAYYPNSSAGVLRCLRKERFLHRKNQL